MEQERRNRIFPSATSCTFQSRVLLVRFAAGLAPRRQARDFSIIIDYLAHFGTFFLLKIFYLIHLEQKMSHGNF